MIDSMSHSRLVMWTRKLHVTEPSDAFASIKYPKAMGTACRHPTNR